MKKRRLFEEFKDSGNRRRRTQSSGDEPSAVHEITIWGFLVFLMLFLIVACQLQILDKLRQIISALGG